MAVEVQYRGDNADTGPSDGVWFDVDPLAYPKKLIHIFDDFVGGVGHGMASAGTVAEVALGALGSGGILNVHNSGSIQGDLAFKHASDKDITFECRISVDDLTNAAGDVGLYKGSGALLAFNIASGVAQLKNQTTNVGGAVTLVADTMVKLGFRVRGDLGDATVTAYLNGVKLGSASTGVTLEASAMRLYVASSHGTNKIAVDWVRAAQLR